MKGFSLVELVITIAIIAVLSMVSVPIYKNYVLNSKFTEGYVLLGSIKEAQIMYYSEYLRFISYTYGPNNNILGIDTRANKYFTTFYINAADTVSFNATVCSKNGNITMIYNKTTGAVTI